MQAAMNLNSLQKKKRYIIDSQTAKHQQNLNNSIKFERESIKSSLCDCFDTFILVTGDIIVTAGNNTDVAFKKCAPFSTFKTEINDVFIDEKNHIDIPMPIFNLIEYNNNCYEHQEVQGSLKEMNLQLLMLI